MPPVVPDLLFSLSCPFVFKIGGGKTQNRQKYDNDLGRYLSAALREIGFREDRAATALMECQGSYKSQHDTHKGIRTVQVCPPHPW
ncbi:unnamed protein product [Ectocarpus sp. 8 AP-2014]